MKIMSKIISSIILILLPLALIAVEDPGQPETRPFQLSLVPSIGTEGLYSQEHIYKVSLNIIAGLTGGVEGIELGGFLNMNRFTMTGIQAAGFGNTVAGRAEGIQFAGFFNANNSSTRGFQGAGFVNLVNDDANALQGSGFANIVNGNVRGIQGTGFANIVNGDIRGVQAAGFANAASGDGRLVQAAGFANISGGSIQGLQAAGFGNIAEQAKGVQAAAFGNVARQAEGVQAAGFMNIAGVMEGIQASGFLNVAGNIEGVQAAGFINVASKVQGLQAGFINIADTIVGLPIGFLSIVRDGYRKLELSAGDAMNLNLGFKIGVRHFYNMFATGFQFTSEDPVFSYGYGIGTELNLPERRYLNIELLTHQMMQGRWWDYTDLNLLGQLRVTYAMDMSDRWQFFAGPVANIHISRANDNETVDIAPYEMFRFTGRNTENVVWIGINTGFRFW
jgi:hypothetical protein